jgi:hypothetical protein
VDNLTITIGAIWFVFGWYGLSKVVGRLSRGLQQSRVVWCSRGKTFSLVETEPAQAAEETKPVLRHCLLWPEFHDCNQSCLRSKPNRFFRRATAKQAR